MADNRGPWNVREWIIFLAIFLAMLTGGYFISRYLPEWIGATAQGVLAAVCVWGVAEKPRWAVPAGIAAGLIYVAVP